MTRLNKNIAQVILIDSTGCLKKGTHQFFVITFKNKVITKNRWVPFFETQCTFYSNDSKGEGDGCRSEVITAARYYAGSGCIVHMVIPFLILFGFK